MRLVASLEGHRWRAIAGGASLEWRAGPGRVRGGSRVPARSWAGGPCAGKPATLASRRAAVSGMASLHRRIARAPQRIQHARPLLPGVCPELACTWPITTPADGTPVDKTPPDEAAPYAGQPASERPAATRVRSRATPPLPATPERFLVVLHVDADVLRSHAQQVEHAEAVDAEAVDADALRSHAEHADCAEHPEHTEHPGPAEHAALAERSAPTEHAEHAGHAALAGGPRVSAETARRLACDARLLPMLHDRAGRTLALGRRTRSVPPALRRALEHRDHARCRFPGCDARLLLDAHHLHHWADGGETRLENLLLLCRRHHRLVHEGGVRVELTGTGEARFCTAGGRRIVDAPALPRAPRQPVRALERVHDAAGLAIHGWTAAPTATPLERLDLDFTIRTLRGAMPRS